MADDTTQQDTQQAPATSDAPQATPEQETASQPVEAPADAPEEGAVEVDGALLSGEGEQPVGASAGAWATNDAAAPEVLGTGEFTQSAAKAVGWFGRRRNNHADADYSVPGLGGGVAGTSGAHTGASPSDYDNPYDAPGGVNPGSGSYNGQSAGGIGSGS